MPANLNVAIGGNPVEVSFDSAAEAKRQADLAASERAAAVQAKADTQAAQSVAETARDQAADLVRPENIFIDELLQAVEQVVTAAGTFFKIVDSTTGLATVYEREQSGSAALYSEATAEALGRSQSGFGFDLIGKATFQDLHSSTAAFTAGRTLYASGIPWTVLDPAASEYDLETAGGVKLACGTTENIFNIIDFGAPLIGLGDAADAIDRALAAAGRVGGTVVWPQRSSDVYSPSFYTSRRHIVPNGVSTDFQGVLSTGYVGPGPAIEIGNAATFNHRVSHVIQLVRATQSDWSDPDCVGVRLTRTNLSSLFYKYISGFTHGVEEVGDGGGFVHNRIRYGEILNNKIHVRCLAKDGGWYNRNTQQGGGRLAMNSGVNTTVSRYGVWVERINSGYYINSNIWELFDFEPAVNAGFNEAVAFVMEGGLGNLITVSDDISKVAAVRLLGECYDNEIDLIYDGARAEVQDRSIRGDNIVRRRTTKVTRQARGAWQSGSLAKKVVGYDSTGSLSLNVKGHSGYGNGGPAISIGGVAVTPTYLQIGAGVGLARRLHVKPGVQYLVHRHVLDSYAGRVAIACFDASGARLPGAVANRVDSATYAIGDLVRFPLGPYALGGVAFKCITAGQAAGTMPTGIYSVGDVVADGEVEWVVQREPVATNVGINPAYSASKFGGCFAGGSDTELAMMMLFRADVAVADIILSGGTAPCRLVGWSISSADGSPVSTLHPMGLNDDTFYGYQSPQVVGAIGNGGHPIGLHVLNASPAAGEPIAWASSAEGDPGVWLPWPSFA